MTIKKFKFAPIFIGFPWSATFNVNSTPVPFPASAEIHAQVRTSPFTALLATISTETGGIIRLDDNRVTVRFTEEQTAKFPESGIMFDLVRVSNNAPTHLGIRINVPVAKSVSAPTIT